jgi:hypothetical protein
MSSSRLLPSASVGTGWNATPSSALAPPPGVDEQARREWEVGVRRGGVRGVEAL